MRIKTVDSDDKSVSGFFRTAAIVVNYGAKVLTGYNCWLRCNFLFCVHYFILFVFTKKDFNLHSVIDTAI